MLVDALLAANRHRPDTVAVEDGHTSLTYRRLTLLASILRKIVSRKTECKRIAVMLPASSLFPAALFGVLWSSRITVPLNFLLNAKELARVVRDAELDLILTIRHFADLSARLPAETLLLDELPLKRKLAFASLKRLPPPPDVDPHATAVILYTSGTTAEPRGVELTHHNLHSNCVDAIQSLEMELQPTFLNILPPFHVFGLTANVLIPVVLASRVCAIPRFSPLAVVRTIAATKVSVMLAIPSMYAALLRLKSAKPDDFRSIRLAISGGEPLPASIARSFEERFGVRLCQGYGLTEASPVVSTCSANVYREGSVGRPIRNVEIRIVDGDGQDRPVGEEGEILVRGPGMMKGYYKRLEETNRVIDADGWFHTGDMGRLDRDGFLTITGRAKETLIIGGENVSPREIEAALESHEAVLQVAVIGATDPSRGEVPIAFVIPQRGTNVTEPELRAFAKRSLAGFKVPRQIHIRDDLPQGPTGKILKRRLRELL